MCIIPPNPHQKSSNKLLEANNTPSNQNNSNTAVSSTQEMNPNEAPLGSITKSNSDFDPSPLKSTPKHVLNRTYSFAMKDIAGQLLPNERVATCMCNRITKDKEISIKHNGKKGKEGRARYGNLMKCGSIWNCYFCARKLLAERGTEVERGLKTWIDDMGGSVFMLTLTIPHYQGGDLDRQLELQRQAIKRLNSDNVMRKVWAKIGKVGQIKALEYTYGKNGHHNHTHTIIFSELSPEEFKDTVIAVSKTSRNNHTLLSDKQVQKLIDKGREYRINYITLEDFIKFYWFKLCRDVGLGNTSLKHGANITDAQNVKTYLTKLKTAQELTNASSKQGKNGNRNQWQLLTDFMNGDEKAGQIFKMYASAYKGERQLHWSNGLKELLGVAEVDDKQILENESEDDIEMVQVLGDIWHLVKRKKLQAHLLHLAENDFNNGTDTLLLLLARLRREVEENRQKQGNGMTFEEWQSQLPPFPETA